MAAALCGLATILFAPELFGACDNFGLKFPWGCGAFNRNLAQDYGVACGFSVMLYALRGLLDQDIRPSLRLERLVRKAGALTFPLYCLHYPLLCLACAISPFAAQDPRRALFAGASAFLAVAALTPLCERLKLRFRQIGALRGALPVRA
jgi:peptidoglycan/LPS O-acetylase OafA/YrhL